MDGSKSSEDVDTAQPHREVSDRGCRKQEGRGPVIRSRSLRAAILTVVLTVSCQHDPSAVTPPDEPPQPSVVVLTPPALRMTAHRQFAFVTAEVRDQYGKPMSGYAIAWESSNPAVAGTDITDQPMVGAIVSLSDGEATITARVQAAEGISGTMQVTVHQEAAEVSVTVPPTHAVLVAGDTVRLSAAAEDAMGNPMPHAKFTWASRSPLVASVDAQGLVAALGQGEATITATLGPATGSSDVLVVRSLFPFHIHEVPSWSGVPPIDDMFRDAIAEAVRRWGAVLVPSVPRPYVFQADPDCPSGMPGFRAGDTLEAGIHIWVSRTAGSPPGTAADCIYDIADRAAIADSLEQIPAGLITMSVADVSLALHEIGHVLQFMPGDSYTYETQSGRTKTVSIATSDRAREAVEYIWRRTFADVDGGGIEKELDWAKRFPTGVYGIPMLSYYDNSPYPPEGHLNSCVAAKAERSQTWGGETLVSREANDIMMLGVGSAEYPAYITRLTLATINFPGYMYAPEFEEAELGLYGTFSERSCYG